MFLLFGEDTINKVVSGGEFHCPLCRAARRVQHVSETSYFTLFMIPLLPLRRRSDYCECTRCGTAFASEDSREAAVNPVLRHVLVYVMLGYGAGAHRDTLRQIFERIAGARISDEEMEAEADGITRRPPEILDYLKRAAYHLNQRAKEQVVEAAFLMTHASCEIQQQDRMRVNLMGAALGMSIAQVDTVIDRVRAQRYYGVRRNLITS